MGRVRRALVGRASPASSACPASPARPARRRSRTSAPTGRRSRRRSGRARLRPRRARRGRTPGRGVRLPLPHQWLQGHRHPRRARRHLRARALGRGPSRSATPSSPARSVCGSARVPLAAAREAVLRLRRGKGMVLDPADHDTCERRLVLHEPDPRAGGVRGARAPRRARLGPDARPPAFPEPDGRVKISAAWLIERAGFARGLERGRVAISAKHALALVNRGDATTAELVALAREIAAGVASLRRRRRPRAGVRRARVGGGGGGGGRGGEGGGGGRGGEGGGGSGEGRGGGESAAPGPART